MARRDRTVPGIGYAQYNRDVEGYPIKTPVPFMPSVVFERIHDDAVLPKYAKDGDSGMDVHAVEDITIAPGETVLVPLGLLVEIPRHPYHAMGYRWELQARPRSGVSAKTTLRVANAPGTVDNTFRGELKIIMENVAHIQYNLECEHDEETRAVDKVELENQHTSYVRGVDGADIFTGNFSVNQVGTHLIRKGDRIAQLVFAEVIRPLEIVEGIVDKNTDRGADGFGSTGVRP